MTESFPQETASGEESLADTETELVEIAKGQNGDQERPLSDTEPEDGQLQEGDEGG